MGGRGKNTNRLNRRGSQTGSRGNNPSKALELYRKFIEGYSSDIHTGSEKDKKVLDTIFEPAQQDLDVYKGYPVRQEDLSNLPSLINSYASTSMDRMTALDYANRAYDIGEDFIPLRMNIHVEKGTPVADARKLLGTSGMKAYEKEITIGRNATYSYSNLKRHVDTFGDEYYTVDVRVRRRSKK